MCRTTTTFRTGCRAETHVFRQEQAGIGKVLLAFLEASAQRLGYSEIWLETRHVNARAVKFYERNGYRVIDNYGPYIGRQEAVCLAKKLALNGSRGNL